MLGTVFFVLLLIQNPYHLECVCLAPTAYEPVFDFRLTLIMFSYFYLGGSKVLARRQQHACMRATCFCFKVCGFASRRGWSLFPFLTPIGGSNKHPIKTQIALPSSSSHSSSGSGSGSGSRSNNGCSSSNSSSSSGNSSSRDRGRSKSRRDDNSQQRPGTPKEAQGRQGMRRGRPRMPRRAQGRPSPGAPKGAQGRGKSFAQGRPGTPRATEGRPWDTPKSTQSGFKKAPIFSQKKT